jgi:hypothetical protein
MRRLIDPLIFAVAVMMMAWGSATYASTTVYISHWHGNDSNDGLSSESPITATNGTYSRAIELGIMGDDTGLVIIDNDTPPIQLVRSMIRAKSDKALSEVRSDTNGWVLETDFGSVISRMRINEIRIYDKYPGQEYYYVSDVIETICVD